MLKDNQSEISIKNAVTKNGLILALFALIATGLVAIIHLVTKDKIKQEIELSMLRELKVITDPTLYNNDVYNDCLFINSPKYLGSSDNQKAYRMRLNQAEKPIGQSSKSLEMNGTDLMAFTHNKSSGHDYGVMLTTIAPDGYSGKIEIAVAIQSNGKILGVNILSHQETPGLGDKIERRKSAWLQQFVGLSLKENSSKYWSVKKDGGEFDALTGATITPRAVISSVHKSLVYFQQYSKELFESSSNCGDKL